MLGRLCRKDCQILRISAADPLRNLLLANTLALAELREGLEERAPRAELHDEVDAPALRGLAGRGGG